MADIDIVPKRGTSIWLWVVLVVLALAVIFWFLAGEPGPVSELQSWYRGALASAATETPGQLAA